MRKELVEVGTISSCLNSVTFNSSAALGAKLRLVVGMNNELITNL